MDPDEGGGPDVPGVKAGLQGGRPYAAMIVFVVSLILLYGASTTYHTVNLAGREDLWTIARSESPYAITWSTKPDDSVTFVLDDATLALGFKAEVCEAGLKLCPPLGTMIFIR